MEEQQTNSVPESTPRDVKHHFTTVTPLSKFLAMVLFIAMPFAGFGLGLKYGMEMKTESLQGVVERTETVAEDTTTAVEPEPTGAPTGKINVKVACESALAYTTFDSGAAADAFVADCIDGKHPEVIDRYIKDLGVDGAAI